VEARELKLIPGERDRGARGAPRPATARLLGLLVVGASLAATWLGADDARRTIEVRELAEEALQTALERGSRDRDVRDALVDLRRALGWRPLESKTRVVYASLVLGLATRLEDMRLAAFHADRAADLSPVTVPVVRAAAVVLASTGELDRALALIRRMFGYDATRAASTLAQIESLVLGVALDAGIPDAPEAWLAWSRQLRQDGRRDEAASWLERTHERWPDHVPTLARMAAGAFGRRDWTALEALLPPERRPGEEPAAAPLFIWRAHLALRRGDRDAALGGLETALRLQPSRSIRTLAGDVFEQLGEVPRARREWNRALHDLDSAQVAARRPLLLRLARLEDRHGRPATALRHWEALLAIDPDHSEARRRVDDLSGFRR
jgi:tetratricopeptide (TPR) repeat protein